MGQYRLWLYHREIDQLLRMQLKTQEKELARVDDQINLLANKTLQADNAIIQALLKEFQAEAFPAPVPIMPVEAISSQGQPPSTSDLVLSDVVSVQDQRLPGSVSSALFTWGRLPNFASQEMKNPTGQTALSEPVPPTPLSAENLLPTDMQTFVEAHSRTAPQTKLPWRFPNAIRPSHRMSSESPTDPVDQQSTHVNQLVKRWFERRTRFAQETRRERDE